MSMGGSGAGYVEQSVEHDPLCRGQLVRPVEGARQPQRFDDAGREQLSERFVRDALQDRAEHDVSIAFV